MNRKLILGLAAVLFALCACDDNDKDDNGFDEQYYAEHASISCSDAGFTANSEGGAISFKASGGEVVVNVSCGVDWDVRNSASDVFTTVCDWNNGTLTVSAGQNTIEAERTATLSLVTVGLQLEFATLAVSQNAYGAPEITVSSNEWRVPAVGELSTVIAVDCPIDWEVDCPASWLSVEKAGDGISITASENEDVAERTAEIRLSCTDGIRSDSEVVTVVQDAKAYVSPDKALLEVVAAGETASVSVESNYEWDYSYNASNGWFTLERTGDVLTATVTENNPDEDSRSGVITLTAGDGAENVAVAEVEIVQAGESSALIFVYTTTAANTEVTLPLYGEVDCTVVWGDGETENVTVTNPTHVYAEAGSYDVKITGTVTALTSCNRATTSSLSGVTKYLSEVKQWGRTGLNDMERAIYGCTLLTTLPEDSSGAFKDVTTFRYAFRGCSGLTEIPEKLFVSASNATSFEACFFGCSKLTTMPENLFVNCSKVTEFEHLFYNCSALESVPENLFANCPNVLDFTQTFGSCKKLTEIPENIFAGNTKATTFTGTFNSCTGLTTVPAGLFANNTAITVFDYTFEQCTNLATVPEGLFARNTDVTMFQCTFYKCSSLATIPEGLFSNNTKVTRFLQTFESCKAITEVPVGLFANNTAVTSFQSVFNSCSALASIPENLFANNNVVVNFTASFYGCPITEIPAKLFAPCPAATQFTETFMACTSLTTIPDGLLDGCPEAYYFSEMFSGCTKLTTIANPEGLFANCPYAYSFENTFYNCSGLTSDISGIFVNNQNVYSFYRTFYGCKALTCESPYNTLDDGTKVHLYERGNYPDLFDEPAYMSGCFNSCTGLTDYADIPSSWR